MYAVILKSALGMEAQRPTSLIPLSWWEFLLFVPFCSWFAWFITNYVNSWATSKFEKIFDCVYCCCCCCCQIKRGGGGAADEDTLVVIVEAIAGLTGAEVDGTTHLDQIGLDSFGAGALVGVLVARIPGLLLKVSDTVDLVTVGDLRTLVDQKLAAQRTDMVASV